MNWDNDRKLSGIARPMWKELLCEFFNTDNYMDMEDDLEYQKLFKGDVIVNDLTVELKIVRWNKFYMYNNTIFLEDVSNDKQPDKPGSGVKNCNADVWAYGMFDINGLYIEKYNIYDCNKLKNRIKDAVKEKWRQSKAPSTNDLYHTYGWVVPLEVIKECEIESKNPPMTVKYRCHICWKQITIDEIYRTVNPYRVDQACFNFCSKECFEKPHDIDTIRI